MDAPHRHSGRDDQGRPLTVSRVRRQAWMVSSLWWLAAAAGYGLFARSRPGPQPGCEADGCWNEQLLLFLLGIFIGLPTVLVGMILCAIIIGFRAKRAKSGIRLGTFVAWAGIGVVLVSLRLLTLR